MAQSIFENLSKTQTNTYNIGNGESITITIDSLALGDIAEIDMTNVTQRLELILRSIARAHPDESIDTIKLIPLLVARPLTEDIFRFNGMTLPEADAPEDDD